MSDVRDFGASGDGKQDDTEAIRHAVRDGDGVLYFPRGEYRITAPIEIELNATGRSAVDGDGGTAKLIMAGEGPALRLVGTHESTANPAGFEPRVWASQRMPTVRGIEIEGAHEKADGVELVRTMQSTLEGVLVRRCRDGVRIRDRARNVILTHCHIYHNTGIGVFIDRANLHQINIASSHISYNRLGGIRVEDSDLHNLQITGNDIEYNNHRSHDADPDPTAEIYADGGLFSEVTIASNTIQATPSAGGANIRIIGYEEEGEGPEMGGRDIAITGNVIGSHETNLHFTGSRDVVISGNFVYDALRRNLLMEGCRRVVLGANTFRHDLNPPEGDHATGVRLVECSGLTMHGCNLHDHPNGKFTGRAKRGLLEIEKGRRIIVTGCQLTDGRPHGIDVAESSEISITGCHMLRTDGGTGPDAAVRWRGEGRANRLSGNTLGGHARTLAIDEAAGVHESDNLDA